MVCHFVKSSIATTSSSNGCRARHRLCFAPHQAGWYDFQLDLTAGTGGNDSRRLDNGQIFIEDDAINTEHVITDV
jgi:hypothetical protein